MNIFELRGPEFLLVYGLLAAAATTVVVLVGGWVESGPVPRMDVVDPYLVAYLRDGSRAATRVAVLSLIDRGLLTVDGRSVTAVEGAAEKVRRPLERAILNCSRSGIVADTLPSAEGVKEVLGSLQTELCQLGVVATGRQKVTRAMLSVAAVAALWLVAAHKLDLAAQHDHRNVGLLKFTRWAALTVLLVLIWRRRTSIGNRLLRDLRELFSGLKARASTLPPGGATNEATLVAAVFGVAAMGGVGAWAAASALFPTNANAANSGSSSSCGSSCGGGGCGGGCGGCGS